MSLLREGEDCWEKSRGAVGLPGGGVHVGVVEGGVEGALHQDHLLVPEAHLPPGVQRHVDPTQEDLLPGLDRRLGLLGAALLLARSTCRVGWSCLSTML